MDSYQLQFAPICEASQATSTTSLLIFSFCSFLFFSSSNHQCGIYSIANTAHLSHFKIANDSSHSSLAPINLTSIETLRSKAPFSKKMFRRLPNQLPKDITFPTDLASLGYFINDNDQIRQIAHPDKKYQYKINRSDRVNDVYKEAMNSTPD